MLHFHSPQFFVVYEGVEMTAVVLNSKYVASSTATSLNPSLSALQSALQVNALQFIGIGLVGLVRCVFRQLLPRWLIESLVFGDCSGLFGLPSAPIRPLLV